MRDYPPPVNSSEFLVILLRLTIRSLSFCSGIVEGNEQVRECENHLLRGNMTHVSGYTIIAA